MEVLKFIARQGKPWSSLPCALFIVSEVQCPCTDLITILRKSAAKEARVLEASVQQVVEILQPGPLGVSVCVWHT